MIAQGHADLLAELKFDSVKPNRAAIFLKRYDRSTVSYCSKTRRFQNSEFKRCTLKGLETLLS